MEGDLDADDDADNNAVSIVTAAAATQPPLQAVLALYSRDSQSVEGRAALPASAQTLLDGKLQVMVDANAWEGGATATEKATSIMVEKATSIVVRTGTRYKYAIPYQYRTRYSPLR